MKVKITVTEAHIKSGRQNDCGKCPVALAITPLLNKDYYLSVGDESFDIISRKSHNPFCIYFPTIVRDFIPAFDGMGKAAKHLFKSFSFSLNIPKQYLK